MRIFAKIEYSHHLKVPRQRARVCLHVLCARAHDSGMVRACVCVCGACAVCVCVRGGMVLTWKAGTM